MAAKVAVPGVGEAGFVSQLQNCHAGVGVAVEGVVVEVGGEVGDGEGLEGGAVGVDYGEGDGGCWGIGCHGVRREGWVGRVVWVEWVGVFVR